ncbi:MAG TPA: hypothetical protein PKA53_13170 [Sphingobacterium sp.]|nr:hypothetical protein [Sphingobacterium sp.]
MKGALLSFMVVCFVSFSKGQTINLDDIRKDFNKGIKDEELCHRHWRNLEKHAKSTVEKGYQAAFHMFMAKHTGNPIKKMHYFNGGKKLLEQQIVADANNIELRFIRLCIQYYIPDFLGYKEDIEKDKVFMRDNLYKLQDEDVKSLIYRYLKGAKMYSDEELALLGR